MCLARCATKVKKMEGPTEILIFLGVLIDTSKIELRLPIRKLNGTEKSYGTMEIPTG